MTLDAIRKLYYKIIYYTLSINPHYVHNVHYIVGKSPLCARPPSMSYYSGWDWHTLIAPGTLDPSLPFLPTHVESGTSYMAITGL